jgi:hypothetical protein
MTEAKAAELRAPFAPEQIGKLPKPTKRDNPKGKCKECGGWHGLPAVHLDYVGHAAITDRLLKVDPLWTWEPQARDEFGAPKLDAKGGLWINLTVCGVTRPGYGDETNGKGMKEIIGDALRNGAMRFGVGLDLWSKENLWESEQAKGTTETPPSADDIDHSASVVISKAQRTRLFAVAREVGVETDKVRETIVRIAGVESSNDIPKDKYDAVIQALHAYRNEAA